MTTSTPTLTKRQFALNTLIANQSVLTTDTPKAFRATCMQAIVAAFPATSKGSLGAIYNDAKHILINAGTLPVFGRYGKGRNHNSADAVSQTVATGPTATAEDKWQVANKATGAVIAYATSRAKAYVARTDSETQRISKIAA